MSIEAALRRRIQQLAEEGRELAVGDRASSRVRDEKHAQQCQGWIAAVTHVVSSVCPRLTDPYRVVVDRLVEAPKRRYIINTTVGELSELLFRLISDVDEGLIASVAEMARGETFDDLLDRADEYLRRQHKEGAAVLTTAVFEDTMRRIAGAHSLAQPDDKMDRIIAEMEKAGIITSVVAKRCRAAAGLRNSALHARWDEFTLHDVEPAISLTRQLIEEHLAR